MTSPESNNLPPIKKRLSLPAALVVQVDLRLYDPLLGKAAYGGWSELVTALLREWLQRTGGKERENPPQQD